MIEPYKRSGNLLQCCANESKAFELTTIENHYLSEIKIWSKGQRKDLKNEEYLDLNEFNQISYDKLIKASIENLGS